MGRLSILPIVAVLAAPWFAHVPATANESAEVLSAGPAEDLYDNVITFDDLYELFTLYLTEHGLSTQDSRRAADSARRDIEQCRPRDRGCFARVLQEHGLVDAMQWIFAKVHGRK